jgi:hypothetical protein
MHRAAAILVAVLAVPAFASGSPYSPDPSLLFRSYDRLDCPRRAELERPSRGSGGGRMVAWRFLPRAASQGREPADCVLESPGAGAIRYGCGETGGGSAMPDLFPPAPVTEVRIRIEERIR